MPRSHRVRARIERMREMKWIAKSLGYNPVRRIVENTILNLVCGGDSSHIELMRRCLMLLPLVFGLAGANEIREPSEFRLFRDKQNKEIEARVLSIADDLQSIRLEKRDGASYEISVTVLSLDDQQFVHDWLKPDGELRGGLRVFGLLSDGNEISASLAEGETKFQSIHAAKFGWIALLPDGNVLDSVGRYSDLSPVSRISSNTVWVAMANQNGKFVNGVGDVIRPEISTAVQCVNANGHSAALLADGTVKIFGRRYDRNESFDAPGEISGIVSLASNQGRIAAIGEDGVVHSWGPGETKYASFTPGEGAVEIKGNIFNFIALTRSGEVYQWNGGAFDKARIPPALKAGEKYIKVRANGSTMAAQREDKTWIAWGMNGAGIIDHINSLGPTEDIAFFSEPGKKEHGFVVWIEEELGE